MRSQDYDHPFTLKNFNFSPPYEDLYWCVQNVPAYELHSHFTLLYRSILAAIWILFININTIQLQLLDILKGPESKDTVHAISMNFQKLFDYYKVPRRRCVLYGSPLVSGAIIETIRRPPFLVIWRVQLFQFVIEEPQALPYSSAYDGPGVTTQTHTPEVVCLCVVKRHIHTHTPFKHKNTNIQKYKYTKTQIYKNTNIQNTRIQIYKNTNMEKYKYTKIQKHKLCTCAALLPRANCLISTPHTFR